MTAGVQALVSIVIPSFNRAHVVAQAVDSALAQTYPHIEIVVVDDGSTDDTLQRLGRIASPRLIVLSSPRNGGPAQARNLGIAHSIGDYVAFLDSDDQWAPDKIAAQIACFRRGGPRLGAVYCGRRVRLPDGGSLVIRPRHRGDVFAALLRRNTVPLPTVMVRRAVLDDVGLFDPGLPACEDWDLVLRIARRYAFDYVADPAVVYDGTGADRMSARARSVFVANHRIFRRHAGRRPGRAVRAGYLALQSRELLHLGRTTLAVRYALASLRRGIDEDRLALRTLRRVLMRRRLGRVVARIWSLRRALTWRPGQGAREGT